MLPEPINKAVHFGIGVWVGLAINDPKFRHGAYVYGAYFLAYQVVEVWTKQDKGYHEIAQFTYGLAAALAYRRWESWSEERRSKVLRFLIARGREARDFAKQLLAD